MQMKQKAKSMSHLVSVFLLSALVLTGCAGSDPAQGPETSAAAVDFLGFALDAPSEQAAQVQMGQGPLQGVAKIARQCDPSPKIQKGDLCGRSTIQSAQFQWSGCTINLPKGAPAPSFASSGSLVLSSKQTGSCQAQNASLALTTTFNIKRNLQQDVSMHIVGTTVAERSQANPNSMTVKINLSRKISKGERVGPTIQMTGTLRAMRSDKSQKISGSLNVSINHPRFGKRESTVVLSDVVRTPHTCRWPIGGTLKRTFGKTSHTLVFGRTCGQGTLDGNTISLDSLRGQFAGQSGVGGRPN